MNEKEKALVERKNIWAKLMTALQANDQENYYRFLDEYERCNQIIRKG